MKFCAGFFAFLVSIYLPFLKWRKDPTQKDKEIISLFNKKCIALANINPQELFIQFFCLIKRVTKFDVTKIENGTGLIANMSVLFSWTGISFTLSRRVLKFVKDKIDMSDVKSVLYYKLSQSMFSCTSGNWPEEIEFDHHLVDKNLALGEFFFSTTTYIVWNLAYYTARGNFSSGQWLAQRLSYIDETYENDYTKVLKFFWNTFLLMKYRRLNDGLGEADTGTQFVSKTGFRFYLIGLYANKARIQLMLMDMSGAIESLKHAENIKF